MTSRSSFSSQEQHGLVCIFQEPSHIFTGAADIKDRGDDML